MMCIYMLLSFEMIVTAVHTTPWPHRFVFFCTTPRRGGLTVGTARSFLAEQAVPRGRSRSFEPVDGEEAPKTYSW